MTLKKVNFNHPAIKRYCLSMTPGLFFATASFFIVSQLSDDAEPSFIGPLVMLILISLPGAVLSFMTFSKKFELQASFLKHSLWGVQTCAFTVFITSLVITIPCNLFLFYNGMWFGIVQALMFPVFLMAGMLPGILSSGLFLGWLNLRATSSHQ